MSASLALFAATATLMSLLAAALVLLPLLRKPRLPSSSAPELLLDALRSHARELDADLAAHRLTREGYDAARADLEARLVLESSAAPALPQRRPPRGAAIALAVAVPVLAATLYGALGDPAALRAASSPYAREPDIDDLRQHLTAQPSDARGWIMLARAQASAGDFAAAVRAYEQAVASPKVARDPGIWCEYADALGMAQGGTLSGGPAKLIAKALALDPAHPQALEMAGSLAWEARDYAGAAQHWRTLLAELDPSSLQARELANAIARADQRAAVTLPATQTLARARGTAP